MKRKRKTTAVFMALIVAGLALLYAGNNWLQVSRYEIVLEGLPENLDGFKIVHISDLHGKEFGRDNIRLARVIEKQDPDLILVSGDMINSRHDDGSAFINLLRGLADRYPIYCSLGNHEQNARLLEAERYRDFERRVAAAGGVLLDNARVEINFSGLRVAVYGFTSMLYHYTGSSAAAWQGSALEAPFIEEKVGRPAESEITVLLAHNPKYFAEYARWGADLVLAGHVHGGVIRLPFLGGVFSPDITFFPAYDAGLYTLGTSQMHVSRGLGNSVIPVRLFNRPDVSVIVLKTK